MHIKKESVRMKRSFVLFFILIPVLLTPSAYAQAPYPTNTYTLEDLYMTVEVPQSLIAVTRDIKFDESTLQFLEAFGWDETSLKNYLYENNIYLETFPSNDKLNDSIQIICENADGTGIFSWNTVNKADDTYDLIDETNSRKFKEVIDYYLNDNMSAVKLEFLKKNIGENIESYSTLNLNGSNYRNGKFILRYINVEEEYSIDGTIYYKRRYITIHNGKIITLSLTSAGEPPTNEICKIQDEMMYSIVFTKTLTAPIIENEFGLDESNNKANFEFFFKQPFIKAISGALSAAVVVMVAIVFNRIRRKMNFKKNQKL